MAMMTAELSSLVKEEHGVGFVVWIQLAFGRFVSFQAGLWSCVCNILDKALYPVLFLDYLQGLLTIPPDGGDITDEISEGFEPWTRWFICVALITVVLALNLRGIEVVGKASYVFFFLTLLPFIIFCILAVPVADPKRWWEFGPSTMPNKGTSWPEFISLLMWHSSGWDNVGLLAAETINPQKTYPKAMVISLVLVTITYLIPVMFATSLPGLGMHWVEWKDGDFERLAAQLGGPILQRIFVVGAAACCVGIFTALLTTSARQMFSMARAGLLPSPLGRLHPKWGTPTLALLVNGFIVALLAGLPFTALLEATVIANAMVTGITFSAFLVLRTTTFIYPSEGTPSSPGLKSLANEGEQELREDPEKIKGDKQEDPPFRIPIATNILIAYTLIPLTLCGLAIFTAPIPSKMMAVGLIAAGCLLYWLFRIPTGTDTWMV